MYFESNCRWTDPSRRANLKGFAPHLTASWTGKPNTLPNPTSPQHPSPPSSAPWPLRASRCSRARRRTPRPPPPPAAKKDALLERTKALIEQLGSDVFMVRERASEQLKALMADEKAMDR